MGDNKLTPSDIVIMAAGVVMLIASFISFEADTSAWGSGLFPLAWFPMLFGVIMALHIVLTTFANVNLPERLLDFTWNQVHLVLSIVSVLLMLCFLLQKFPGGASPDKNAGFWLMLLGSIALVVGAVLRVQQAPAAAGPSSTPPTTF